MSESVLITGAHGCIGAWTVRELAARGTKVLALDLYAGWGRMEYLVEAELREQVTLIQADITDTVAMREVFAEYQPERVIHLAALLAPDCRDDPRLGARVNIEGTINLLELAIDVGAVAFIYASTAVVFGPRGIYSRSPISEDAYRAPSNHYGAFKAADELIARAYWQDRGFSTVGLRPNIVYGPGRDTGTTADPTIALGAAAKGETATIHFTGPMNLQFAPDVAYVFTEAALQESYGSPVYNLPGTVITVNKYVDRVEKLLPEAEGLIAVEGEPLPWPAELESIGLESHIGSFAMTPFSEGLRQTIDYFQRRTYSAK